jgi:DUF4097 and DUF4098 domain-containing protein YvlB
MTKFLKVLLFVGISVVIVGGIFLGIAIGTHAFSKEQKITNDIVLEEEFDNFDIDVSISDIYFKKSDNDKNKVELIEKKKLYHEVKVDDNTLVIKSKDDYQWYENILNFDFSSVVVTIYLTEDNYDSFNIKSSTGEIFVPDNFTFNSVIIKQSTGNTSFEGNCLASANIEASTGDVLLKTIESNDNITIKTSTGDIELEDVKCKKLTATASTGKVKLDKVLVEDHIELKTSTGSIKLIDSDANTLNIESSTGSVTGNLKTDKTFNVESSTGKKDYPQHTTGGECKIKTSTGNIKIEIK